MLSLTQIKHDKFYIDCQDNATLRECVKLLPYSKNWVQLSVKQDGGIHPDNVTIVVEDNSTYFTISNLNVARIAPTYHYSQISEFTHLYANWYDTVHIMD